MRLSALTATIAATLLTSAPLHAKDAKDVLMPEDPQGLAFQNAVGFADAVIADDTVYLSGVVASPNPGETDLKPAYERAFARIGRTLERAGVGWDDVVDLTTFHTDLAAQINDFAEVKSRYIKAPFPAWTAIGIAALYEPIGVVEIKIVAQRAGDGEAIVARLDKVRVESTEQAR
ncbi:Rid family hydrolase [Parasphingorhabdus halotolerans]|uniref:RidA family protein n=1 Tax=Parasphingorhabdus halotolerans TaxID=2725558 RepID=A0A6H2DJ35_9SPHN|nr:Rid family hydrolase [Parasphingorhabdus halotolerans]QJB68689.1 RidA family protein [Parasphingorhabdus halotolerans]